MKSLKNTKESRLNNVVKNTYTALISQVVVLILGFISRGVLIRTLGNEYAGINGLFTNILALISLAELGLGTSMIFTYYKPLSDKDYNKLSSLVNYYKKIYRIIVATVIGLGIIITPFIKWFIKLDNNIEHIYLIFMLYVINTATSYMFVFRTDIIVANQKRFIITNINIITRIVRVVMQIVVLVKWKNFLAYLIIEVVMNVIANIICNEVAKKMYWYCKGNNCDLTKEEKRTILDSFKSSAIYKVAVVIINSTDNILISKIVGTIYVGLYSNYYMISSALNNVLVLVNNSIVATVGNIIASNDDRKKNKVMNVFILVFTWLGIYVTVMYYVFINDFVTLWIGKENVVSRSFLIVITLSLYITFVYNSIAIYREAAGTFRETKNVTVIEAIINIVVSIVLGKIYGIVGIIAGTLVAKACTRLWYEPYVIYKKIIKDKPYKFMKYNVISIVVTLLLIIICSIICGTISKITWTMLIVKMFICTLVINGFMYVLVHPLEEYKYLESRLFKKKS